MVGSYQKWKYSIKILFKNFLEFWYKIAISMHGNSVSESHEVAEFFGISCIEVLIQLLQLFLGKSGEICIVNFFYDPIKYFQLPPIAFLGRLDNVDLSVGDGKMFL